MAHFHGSIAGVFLHGNGESQAGGIPAAPSDVEGVPTSGTTATLSLTDNSAGAASHRWQVRLVAGTWADATGATNPSAPGVTTFAATGLTAATEYEVRARAESGGGDSAYVEGAATFTTDNEGEGGGEIGSGGSGAAVTVSAAGGGTEIYAGSGGSGADVTVTAAGAGSGVYTPSGGSGAVVTIAASGAGSGLYTPSGGSGAAVSVTSAGAGSAIYASSGGSGASVEITAAGGGTGELVSSGGSGAAVQITAAGFGSGIYAGLGGSGALVSITAAGAGSGIYATSGGSGADVSVSAAGAGSAIGYASSGGSSASVLVTAAGAGGSATPEYAVQPQTSASWSYLQTGTLWRLASRATWSGATTYDPPVLFRCDFIAKAERMTDAKGVEFVSRQSIYTSLPGVKQGDRVLIGRGSGSDPVAAGALEVRAITRWADTFVENGAEDYMLVT